MLPRVSIVVPFRVTFFEDPNYIIGWVGCMVEGLGFMIQGVGA